MDRELPQICSLQKLYISFESVAKACKAVQFILEDLELLCDRGSISNETIVSFGEDIKLIGRFLRSVQASTDGYAPFLFPPQEDHDLAMDIVPAIDMVLLQVDAMIRDASFHLCIPLFLPVDIVRNLVERIRSVEIHGHRDDTFLGLTNSQEEENLSGIDGNSIIIDSEIVIGFEDEARELQDKLTRAWFANSAESETTRPSHNRNSPYCSDTDTRNADYTISDVNRSESVDIVRVRAV